MKDFIQPNAIHPGEVLLELYLVPLGLSPEVAAEKLQLTKNKLNAIIKGNANISALTALKLSRAFNTTPFLWTNLQTCYNLSRASRTNKEFKKIKRLFDSSVPQHL